MLKASEVHLHGGGEGEGEDRFKQNDVSHGGVTSQQPGRHFCFDSRVIYIRFAILLKMKI